MKGHRKYLEVVLTKTLHRIGEMGKKKLVKRGFAIHFLYPNGFAVPYDVSLIKPMEVHQKEDFSFLAGKKLYFGREASGMGVLYGSVTKTDIISELKKEYNALQLKASDIHLDEKIKKIGTYKVYITDVELKIIVAKTIEEAHSITLGLPKEEGTVNA